MKVVVAQKGSREHFLVARALQRRGMLAQLVVDWYAPRSRLGRSLLSLLPGRIAARAQGAWASDLPPAKVRPLRGLAAVSRLAETLAARRGSPYAGFLRADAAFASRVAGLELPEHDACFAYSYAALEVLAAEKQRGRLTVLGQIDPGPAEYRLVREEEAAWPQYAVPGPEAPPAYFERVRREWDLADVICVNSEWSRDGLMAYGAPGERIRVIPLAYEPPPSADENPRPCGSDRLRVLWLGSVNLRKGIQYLVEAARLLTGTPVEFLVAGPLGIRADAAATAPPNLRWLGPVPRTRAADLYRQADVFVLPTLSDGFAITQLEALSHGVPVIVTPNCGRVVEDGVTGLVVPPRDAVSLAEAIRGLAGDRDRLAAMAGRCRVAAAAYSVVAYGSRLAEILREREAAT